MKLNFNSVELMLKIIKRLKVENWKYSTYTKKALVKFDKNWFKDRRVAIIGGADSAFKEKLGVFLYAFLYGCTAVTSGASVVFPKETSRILDLINESDFAGAAEEHRTVLKLREVIGYCSSPPSAAHYLLRDFEYNLGIPRPIWPTVDSELAIRISTEINRILNV